MGLEELLGRGRQRVSVWLDEWRTRGEARERHPWAIQELAGENEPGRIADAALPHDLGRRVRRRFERLFPRRFFAGTSERLELAPGDADAILSDADRLCAGVFDLLGFSALCFGDPIDWHLDPVSGRRAPVKHWSRIDFLDPEAVGDSKVIWELNRHQWMVRLGQAYRLTGDERYARTFASRFRDWNRANPVGFGINWASSLEAALRLISWCWCLALFRGSPSIDDALFLELLEGVATHAAHVERYLSFYFSPNTHLTGEALGLFYAGVVLSDARRGRRWRNKGSRILIEQIQRQVLKDGVYFEQSTCYERYTVETYLHFLVLSKVNGLFMPEIVSDKVQRMLDFLLAVRRPDGSIPAIGDSDGGWLLPLAPRGSGDLRGVFGAAAAFFGRGDFAWAAGGAPPEAQWLIGAEGRSALAALRPDPPAGSTSRVFPEGGYAVLRDSFGERAHQLIFDVGPLGCPMSAGHGHADLLSVQVSAFGEPYIVDPGTFGYTVDERSRNYFRGTAAHSTLRVDDGEQADPDGTFSWAMRPRARLRLFLSTGSVELAEGEHHAYCRFDKGAVHRRRVLFVRKAYWVLVDDLEGEDEAIHRVELRFQFAPLKVTLDSSFWARAEGHRGQALLVRCFAGAPLEAEVHEGRRAPMEGWVSDEYGRMQPAPLLVYRALSSVPTRVVTLLFPVEDPTAPAPRVAPILDGEMRTVGLAFRHGESIHFHGAVSQRPAAPAGWLCRTLPSDGAGPDQVVSAFLK
jgi:hypothetical protein